MSLDPGPFTLRELAAMAEGRTRETWNHTAALLAMLANAHRDPKKSRLFRPADFHPLSRRQSLGSKRKSAVNAPITLLKTVFVR